MDAGKARNNELLVSKDENGNFSQARYDASRRWSRLNVPAARDEILDPKASARAEIYQRNIESYIGTIETPLGVAGPLRVHGRDGSADYCVPLATTEAALVASYNRGARLLTASGGCNARVVDEAVSRTPMFAFNSLIEAEQFVAFIRTHRASFDALVEKTTAHGRLVGAETLVEGNHVYLDLRYTTGDASGQNMVTFASNAILQSILQNSPVTPRYWFLEANFSGDKKAIREKPGSDVRGKRVIADITCFPRSRRATPAYNATAHGRLLVRRSNRRSNERHHRHPGALRQRSGGTVPGLRSGHRLCSGICNWRNAYGAH